MFSITRDTVGIRSLDTPCKTDNVIERILEVDKST